jgi:hypothetical protein
MAESILEATILDLLAQMFASGGGDIGKFTARNDSGEAVLCVVIAKEGGVADLEAAAEELIEADGGALARDELDVDEIKANTRRLTREDD